MSVMYMEELFPVATQADIARTKSHLNQYTKLKRALEDFERNPPVSEKQMNDQKKWIKTLRNLDRAVNQIIEHDVKAIIEYRFLRGNSRAATILRFSSWDFCDKTIDRKISEGIESIANTLKYLE